VVPVPSLLALAEQSNESRVIAALDARMNEAYLAAYARNGDDWDEVIAPRLADATRPAAACRAAVGARPAAASTALRGCATPTATGRDALRRRSSARGRVARLAARRFARGGGISAEQAAPLYLRDKVALTTEERRAKR
jgi:tRNA threonylcarbamoyladenosine biosynthesis protein TsaB